jgi:hypothetical protein
MTSPHAFDVIEPRAHFVPLVLDSPHSGTEYPDDFRAAVPLEALRQAEDSFVHELYAGAPAIGATLVAARFPRSYIDPNRSLLDIDLSLIDGKWPGPAVASRKTELGIGLIWRVLDSGEPIYARKLSVQEVKNRIVNYHQPYQKAVKDALDHAHAHFGAVWHLNCHSMPAVSGRISEEGPGKRRADFRARRPRRHDLPRRIHGEGRGGAEKNGLRRQDQRSLQGRGAGTRILGPEGGSPQPASRGQSPPLHGREDAGPVVVIRATQGEPRPPCSRSWPAMPRSARTTATVTTTTTTTITASMGMNTARPIDTDSP